MDPCRSEKNCFCGIVALPRFVKTVDIENGRLQEDDLRDGEASLKKERTGIKRMWYAIQVMSGNERQTAAMCRTLVDDRTLSGVFSPEIEVMKKYEGAWHKERRLMFPGYLFVTTDQPEQLYLDFMHVPKLTKLLGTGKEPVALSEKEVSFLRRILNAEGVVEMSQGVLEGSRLVIQEGPLKGLEGLVKKIDRHKRKAVLEVEMFGRIVDVEMGVEIGRKG